jgi:glucose-1-phosphate adenylyltransferase
MQSKTIGIVLTGGEGKRLFPLTVERNKPAVHIGGRLRLVDIPLSSLVNSGIRDILSLTQGKGDSFGAHLYDAWNMDGMHVHNLYPQEVGGSYEGTADAVRQRLHRISEFNPDTVVIASGDHLVKFDFQRMVQELNSSDYDASVALYRTELAKARDFGAADISLEGKVTAFEEKNAQTKLRVPGHDDIFYASMGIYAFKIDTLRDALTKVKGNDFGKDIMPWLVGKGRLQGYDFSDKNKIPGFVYNTEKKAEEWVPATNDSTYWRDVGLIKDYLEANMDLVGINPEFNLHSPMKSRHIAKERWWPLIGSSRTMYGPSKMVFNGNLENVLYDVAFVANKVSAKQVVFGPDVHCENSMLSRCVITGENNIFDSYLQDTIVDKGARISGMKIFPHLPPGEVIDSNSQGTLYKTKDGIIFRNPDGITVIPRRYGINKDPSEGGFNWKLYEKIPQ